MTTTAPTPGLGRIAAALIVGGIAAIFDSTIVTIGLHTLQTELGADVATIQWVSTAYLLALAIAIPLIPWAQARIGGKRLWMSALLLFLLGSILCSLAWDAPSLIGFRVVQGLGAGIMMPLMQSLLIQAAGGQNLGRLMASVALPIAIGPILGPVLGGVILNWLSWPWMFWVNVPVCLVGLVLAARFLPRDAGSGPRTRFDLLGFLLLAPAFALLLFGLSNTHQEGGFGRLDVWLPGGIGLVLLALFGLHAWRRPEPLVDVRLLRVPSFARTSGVMFFTGIGLFGVMLLLPLFLQGVRGLDVLAAALFLIPQGVGSLASRMVAIKAMERVGAKWVAVGGFLVMTLATLPFAFADAGTSDWWIIAVLFLRGLGLGAVIIPVMSVAYVGLAHDDVPHATVITRISQQLGGSFGTAVLAVILQAATAGAATAAGLAAGFQTAFWWGTGLTAVAVVLSLFLPSSRLSDAIPGAPKAAASEADIVEA